MEITEGSQGHALFAGFVHDRTGKRMFAVAFDVADSRSTSDSVNPRSVIIAESVGFPSVRVPVLSTTSVSTFSITSRISAFLISTPAVAPTYTNHHGHWRRKAERTWTGNDKDRHAIQQRVLQPGRRAYAEPDKKGDDGCHEPPPGRNMPTPGPQAVNRTRGSAGPRPTHRDDLRQQGIPADTLRRSEKGTCTIDGGADHTIASCLLDRNRFAWKSWIHRRHSGLPAQRRQQEPSRRAERASMSRAHLLQRNILVGAERHDEAGGLRRQSEQRPDGVSRSAPRTKFKHLPQEHESR